MRCFDVTEMSGRVCLKLSVAGSRTLQRELAQEGSLSLDYACRYGEDLLEEDT